MSRRLLGGMPRRYPDHRREDALAYRIAFNLLEASHGPFTPEARVMAADVAELRVEWEACTATLKAARRQRESGKGRRPSLAEIKGLQKRAGLARADYRDARADLLIMLGQRRRTPSTPAELLAATAADGS